MRILIAEDDALSCRRLQFILEKMGYEVEANSNGVDALQSLKAAGAPLLAILDIMMPGKDGIEVCREVRRAESATPAYIILLTAKGECNEIVEGFAAGANDYVTKPFNPDELGARVRVGAQMVQLQKSLAERVAELETALSHIRQLQEILPICSYCKSIRDDQNYWQRVESYISKHTNTKFSHSICPGCYESVVKPQLEGMKRDKLVP